MKILNAESKTTLVSGELFPDQQRCVHTLVHSCDQLSRYAPCTVIQAYFEIIGIYRDGHKKLTHLFYNFHGTKRRKDEFADTKR